MIFLLVTTFDQNFYSSPSNYFEKGFPHLAGADQYVYPPLDFQWNVTVER
jgi:hypothetical protein